MTRKARDPETVTLQIDPDTNSWMAQGRPVNDRHSIVRIGYVYQDVPYAIDVPFWTLGADASP